MKRNELKPGDIIATRIYLAKGGFKAFVSKLIGKAQVTERQGGTAERTYSHVAMVDENIVYKLESTYPQSRRTLVDKAKSPCKYEVYRVKRAHEIMSTGVKRVNMAIYWAHQHLGEKYNMLALVFWGLLDLTHIKTKKPVCSIWLGRAWKSAGIMFRKNDEYVSPNEIIFSDAVEFIGELED